MPGSNPYKPLIDVIDILLRKNRMADKGFSVHLSELPVFPLNSIGFDDLKNCFDRLHIPITKIVIAMFYFQKLSSDDENRLLAEKRSLESSSDVKIETELQKNGVVFDDDKAAIKFGDQLCFLPSFKNEHDFCRIMFRKEIDQPVDWSVIYQEMSGTQEVIGNIKNKRTVQDTMYAINNRVKSSFNTKDNLFSWTNKSVKRNF